jgi:hypothetical protein
MNKLCSPLTFIFSSFASPTLYTLYLPILHSYSLILTHTNSYSLILTHTNSYSHILTFIQDPNPYAVTPSYTFTFDHVYFMDTLQETVYTDLGVPILESSLAGYNGTIFAYGQTGAGKTHSITGMRDCCELACACFIVSRFFAGKIYHNQCVCVLFHIL